VSFPVTAREGGRARRSERAVLAAGLAAFASPTPACGCLRSVSCSKPTFTKAAQKIDSHLGDEIERLEIARKQIAQLTAGDSLTLPPEVVLYLNRLREIGV
jgi:hypothetical protein